MSNQTANHKSIEITADNFDALINSDTPTLVDFWAPWCGPCRALGPTIEQLAQDLAGKANIAKLNVDDNPSLAAKFGVSSIPTVLIFQNGKLLETLVGLRPANAYIEALGL